ncbi:MAG: 5-formyltetrahydrofolate cyclo-ligase [Burkholderiaceae bacterium]|nr:5-formyltetrahydrofolate cyclo-ligase [Burkholderiaceae bacterium]
MNDTTRNSRPRIPRSIGDEAGRRDARNTLIAWRRSMDAQLRRAADAAIAARLEAWLAARPAADRAVLGVYWPVRGEPDLRGAMAGWHRAGSAIALPRVAADGAALEFGRWTPTASMREARFGIPLPEPFDTLRPTLLVVPCVGFDVRGYRLGYGGGYYDRTLDERPLPAVGVAYDACEIDCFVPEPHDRPMSAIVTETRTIAPA